MSRPKNDAHINQFDLERIEKYQKAAKDILAGNFPLPTEISFYPSYYCNHKCVGCLYDTGNNVYKGNASAELIEKVYHLAKTLNIQKLELAGGGDPTCHSRFSSMLEIFGNLSAKLGILTNGEILTDKGLAIIAKHGSYIRFSIDSINPETYKAIRGEHANVTKTLDNLAKLIELKKGGKTKLWIGVKFLLSKNNVHEMDDLIAWGKKETVDLVQFKSIRDSDAELDRKSIEIAEAKLKKAKEQMPGKIMGSLLPIEGGGKCYTSVFSPVIDPNGDLFICCYYHNRIDQLRIGNILETNFFDLWGSKKHKQLPDAIDSQKCVHDCRFKMYNQELDRRN